MIARIAIDHLALRVPAQPKLEDRIAARRLAMTVQDFGRVALTGPKDDEEFTVAALAQADSLGYDFWGPVLRAMSDGAPAVLRANPPLSTSTGAHCVDGSILELGRFVDLVVAGAEAPRISRLTDDQKRALYERDGCIPLSDALEVTLPAAIDQCTTIKTLRDLRGETVIRANADREAVWRRLYAPLAEASIEVNVFDKFLFSGLKRWRRQRQSAKQGLRWVRRKQKAPYLLWLLNSLDEHLPADAVVNLYAFTGEEVARRDRCDSTQYTIDDIATCLQALKEWHRPGALHVFLADTVDHDRHIRFSCGHALMSSAGFDHFRFDSENRLLQKFGYTHVRGPESLNALAEVEEDARRVGREWQLTSASEGFDEIKESV